MMSTIHTAVILAAGRGRRLEAYCDEQPKPMTQVNGISIIENLVTQINRAGIQKIVLVVGYLASVLIEHLENAFSDQTIDWIFVDNPIYATTNNIYSLWLAKDFLQHGFYLFEADVFCEQQIVSQLIQHAKENVMVVGKFTEQMNGTVVSLTPQNIVDRMFLKRNQTADFSFDKKYKTVNFYKVGKTFANEFFLKKMDEHIQNEDLNSYYELIIQEAVRSKYVFHGLKTGKSKWWEIDTPEDLKIAEDIFHGK